jgi:hypothetical protein
MRVEAVAIVSELVERLDSKANTTSMSGVTVRKKEALMKSLALRIEAADWLNPTAADDVDGYSWTPADEDEDSQRAAYMVFLRSFIAMPAAYGLFDCVKSATLLSVPSLAGHKLRGTTDVVVAKLKHITERVVKNNIDSVIELKKPKNLLKKNYGKCEAQAIIEHVAASFLAPTQAIVTVLTDLNSQWIFYWFASSKRVLLKKSVARAEARFLLSHVVESSSSDATMFPQDFLARGSWERCFADPLSTIAENVANDDDDDAGDDHDDGGGDDPDDRRPVRRTRESSSSARGPSIGAARNSSSGCRGTKTRTQHTMVSSWYDQQQLGRFCVDSDVANEIDFMDVVECEERRQLVREFVARHIVPSMVYDDGGDDGVADASASVAKETVDWMGGKDAVALSTTRKPLLETSLSELNVRLHNEQIE